MKFIRLLPTLLLLIVGQVSPSYATQAISSSFYSQLRFTGTEWQVKSMVGPIYLARWEDGAWRVLAFFEGTNGKYHLDWENPTKGTYAALDSLGGCSDSVVVGDGQGSEQTMKMNSSPTAAREIIASAAPVRHIRN